MFSQNPFTLIFSHYIVRYPHVTDKCKDKLKNMLYDEDDYETRSLIIKPDELTVHPQIFCFRLWREFRLMAIIDAIPILIKPIIHITELPSLMIHF